MARDQIVLERLARLLDNPSFELLKEEALRKVERNEDSVRRLIFKTMSPVDPLQIQYDRGFSQGVHYALEALPHEILAEFKRGLSKERDFSE